MNVLVICDKCKKTISWIWGNVWGKCPNCGRIKVKSVKLAPGEIRKLFV